MWWLILIYLAVTGLVVLCAVSISSILDQLDKRTKISSVFLGGLVLAIVTSLPDLFTAISSVCFIKEPNLAYGGILGGNIVNLAILGCFMAICFKLYSQTQINKRFLITTISSLIIAVMLFAYSYISQSFVIPAINVNALSIIIVAVYALMLYLNRGDIKQSTAETISTYRYSIKQLVLFFVLSAISLIALAIGLSYITNVLADFYMIDKNLAGALFLGLSTALPEIVTTIVFIRKKNFNLAVSSIVGSVAFNWLILVVSDIFFFGGSIFMKGTSAQLLTGFLTISLALTSISIFANSFAKDRSKWRWLYCSIGVLIVLLTITYLVLSFIYI